mgnify:CR=1 FL=1
MVLMGGMGVSGQAVANVANSNSMPIASAENQRSSSSGSTGKHTPIYGMGRHNHENSVAIPGYGKPVVLSGDDTFTSGPLTIPAGGSFGRGMPKSLKMSVMRSNFSFGRYDINRFEACPLST